MGIEDIRRKYDINATIGTRVKFCGRFGSITGTSGLYLKIKLDGDKVSGVYHPTWNIEYNPPDDTYFDELDKYEDEETEILKKEITEYENKMGTPEFIKEDDELLLYLNEIDPIPNRNARSEHDG